MLVFIACACAYDSLDAIGLRTGTDKSSAHHNFLNFYDGTLAPMRETARHVLEVGVRDGRSIGMWKEYFQVAHLHAWDISLENLRGSRIQQSNASIAVVDQMRPDTLKRAVKEAGVLFDVVVDDGWHSSLSHYNTLVVLWEHLAPGGVYIFEDLHTCVHGHDQQPIGRAFGRCDQSSKQPSMLELLLVLDEMPTRSEIKKLVRLAQDVLPKPVIWRYFFKETLKVQIHLGDCKRLLTRHLFDEVHVPALEGRCDHVTAMVTKRGAWSTGRDALA
jgi:hypothetical protein